MLHSSRATNIVLMPHHTSRPSYGGGAYLPRNVLGARNRHPRVLFRVRLPIPGAANPAAEVKLLH